MKARASDMCNCRNELENKIKEKLSVNNGMIDFELLSSRTYSTFEYRDGKNKTKKQHILHSHCPFCGNPYEVKESDGK